MDKESEQILLGILLSDSRVAGETSELYTNKSTWQHKP